ncbi:unnamed protein product [Toxocara canis]|uniref:Chloride channel CLIC-like protein 1 n=1 Tax=Toxocara canis TaxID=6265 RepID=A0A183UE00_TOXCA|nr:unnamed protein product [Toxocara canis]
MLLHTDALSLLVETNESNAAIAPLVELFNESLNFSPELHSLSGASHAKVEDLVGKSTQLESGNRSERKADDDLIKLTDDLDVLPGDSGECEEGTLGEQDHRTVNGNAESDASELEGSRGFKRDAPKSHISEKTKFSSFDRYRAAHRLLGNRWLYDLWTISQSVLDDIQLPPSLFTFWSAEMAKVIFVFKVLLFFSSVFFSAPSFLVIGVIKKAR